MADSAEYQNQKRSFAEHSDILANVKGIILDIEGTTAPISFVRDELFSYIKENLESYIEGHWDDDELQGDVDALRSQVEKDVTDGVKDAVSIPAKDSDAEDIKKAVIKNVLWQMDHDRKTTSLKQLQGHIWREAYNSGELIGEIYEDVCPALEEWKESGKKLYIYSSGSIEAQKLLFSHTTDGDISDMFSGYFDTTIGLKTEKESYSKIAENIGIEASQLLFLTDIPAEAAAATAAGLKACLLLREGNAPVSEEHQRTYQAVESFYELMKEDFDDLPQAKRHADDAEQSDSNDVIYRGSGDDFRGGYPEDSDSRSRSMPANEESFGAEEEDDEEGDEDDA